MTYFPSEIVTPPEHLPVTATAAQITLVRAVVDEIERTVLWRAVVLQTRKIVIDGTLPILELEPVSSIVSITRWTETDPADVIDPASYDLVSRDPAGALIAPATGYDWPAPERAIGSFSLTYTCGWEVSPETAPLAGDGVNEVPASILLMLNRAISFRSSGSGGVGDIKIGSLDLSVPASYSTDQLPREIASIGRSYAYRPGIFKARRSRRCTTR